MLSVILAVGCQVPLVFCLVLPQSTDEGGDVGLSTDQNAQSDNVSAPEKAAIAVRGRLKYARLAVVCRGYKYESDGSRNEYIHQVDEYWICPEGWRHDEYRGGRETGSFYKEYVYAGKNGFYSNIDRVAEETTIIREGQVREPRPLDIGLGFGFIDELSISPFLMCVGGFPEVIRDIRPGRLDKHHGTVVSYRADHKSERNMLFALDEPHRLIAAESVFRAEEGVERNFIECEYENEEWKSFGIPSQVVIEFDPIGPKKSVEEIVVESFEVFDGCPSSAFTLQALGVPGGASVVNMTEGKQLFFDGQEAVDVTPVRFRTTPLGRPWLRWLAMTVVTFVILTAFLAVVRRPRTESTN
jgi:hypothetical protein